MQNLLILKKAKPHQKAGLGSGIPTAISHVRRTDDLKKTVARFAGRH
jgi:hypothetical protein